jgi:hypothetical protein
VLEDGEAKIWVFERLNALQPKVAARSLKVVRSGQASIPTAT